MELREEQEQELRSGYVTWFVLLCDWSLIVRTCPCVVLFFLYKITGRPIIFIDISHINLSYI